VEEFDCFVPEGAFIQFPMQWVMDMKGDDVKKMVILHWRFGFFARKAVKEGIPVEKCYYESQGKLAALFGMSVNSRTKVGQFLKRMEEMGYISTHKEDTVYEGKVKSRLYIVVNDPNILKGS
jgi:hypothetical protein